MISIYTIHINVETETFNNTAHFFWCILKRESEVQYNCGHGWAKSIESAAADAYHYYLSIILPSHNNDEKYAQ